MIDALAVAAAMLPDLRLEPLESLRGGTRTEVRRLVGHGVAGPIRLVVKAFPSYGEGWAREAAALSVLEGSGLAPRLVAVSDDAPVVVMTDEGAGPSLADRLLGDDPAVATAGTVDWAAAIARLHRATLGLRERFAAALEQRAGDLPIATHTMPVVLAEAAAIIEARCHELGVAVEPGAMDALRGLAELLPDAEHAALSPTDACPDNNVDAGGRLVLLDFEGAEFRHVAWDVAYLFLPWPSCWCSWQLPRRVSGHAREHYREGMADAMPYVSTDQFLRDVDLACMGWAFVSTAWFLPRALADDPPPADPREVRPSRRAMILHRLAGAADSAELPVLAALAAGLRRALVLRWGEVPLDYAPAFAR
ncbi:MAG: hypothetical protein M3Y44_08440 [Actinomycetota bacterium]|nr:hypothetical protein [Actinomycetota bacterium]